jgi:hypothetical protein
MRPTSKCSPDWDESCEYETDVLEFTSPSSHDACTTFKCFLDWGESHDDVPCEIGVFEFFILSLRDTRSHSSWKGGMGLEQVAGSRDHGRIRSGDAYMATESIYKVT